MTDPTITRDAAKLTTGDRIAEGFLPLRHSAEVLFVAPDVNGFVLVAYRYRDGHVAADHWFHDAQIPLEYTADSFGYSREADDPTPVSPARVTPHYEFHEATLAGGE
jgi:hypothetical protein